MNVGDRVINQNGEIGYIEVIDEEYMDVRWLTPNNKLSCCVSFCRISDFVVISDSVVPMPKSKAWWDEAKEFCAGIEAVILMSDEKEKE